MIGNHDQTRDQSLSCLSNWKFAEQYITTFWACTLWLVLKCLLCITIFTLFPRMNGIMDFECCHHFECACSNFDTHAICKIPQISCSTQKWMLCKGGILFRGYRPWGSVDERGQMHVYLPLSQMMKKKKNANSIMWHSGAYCFQICPVVLIENGHV